MLNSWYTALIIGCILGFLSGLGVGGGSLLILWLTLVLDQDPGTARSINLLFFLPSAAVACLFRWKQGCIPFRQIFPAMAAGCIAAAVCSFWGLKLDVTLLKKLFGGLLLFTGLRELFHRPKKTEGKG